MTAPVLAADRWSTNGHLIADVARLGWIQKDDLILDPTFGRGIWWTQWRPDHLVTHDLVHDGVDFRALPEDADTFDAVAFDPPYVSVGGRHTTTIPDLHARYGLTDAPHSPLDVQRQINAGLSEMRRVVKPRGIVMVKCQDYVSSGRLFPGTHYTLSHALDACEMVLVDRLEHLGGVRPQPGGRLQVHARRNLSTLLVLRAL